MDRQPEANRPAADPRTFFAAERTLLAWIRTGLAMMGFGFVVARFGLFLRELAAVQSVPLHQRYGVSLWVGTGLVLLGVAVNVCAVVRNWQIVRRLNQGKPIVARSISLASVVALILAILGLAVAIYLLLGLGQAA
jgi:putative membrane protein